MCAPAPCVGSFFRGLGAGTALGALLGGGAAWMLRNVQKKEAATEQHWELVEQALVYCLVQIQGARCLPADAAAATQRWHAEVVAAVAAHAATLRSALQPSPAVQPQQDALVPLIGTMLRSILAREPDPPTGTPAGFDRELVFRPTPPPAAAECKDAVAR